MGFRVNGDFPLNSLGKFDDDGMRGRVTDSENTAVGPHLVESAHVMDLDPTDKSSVNVAAVKLEEAGHNGLPIVRAVWTSG